MTTQELIIEARKQVPAIAQETKTLWPNDQYEVVFIEKTNGEIGITKIQKGWWTENTNIRFGNYPMTKKQVVEVLDQYQFQLDTMGYDK